MPVCKRMCRWLGAVALCLPLISFSATPIKSIVIFGDSLSDTGNTTHLLKSLRKDENPSYLVSPLKIFVINKMKDYANDHHIPQVFLDTGIPIVTNFFDNNFGPMLADIVSNIKKVPILPGEPYWQSRFSNGRVWIEYLAPMLAIDREDREQFVNMAFAGSWAASYDYQLTFWNFIEHPLISLKNLIVGKLIPPSLGLSVQSYLMMNKARDNQTAYFVFAGGNDYLNVLQFGDHYDEEAMNAYIENVLDNIKYSVNKLAVAGAKHIVIMGLPHIGDAPKFAHTAEGSVLNAATDMHNVRLKDRMIEWKAAAPEVDFMYLDVNSFLAKAQVNPSTYGFTNIDEACIDVKLPMVTAFASSSFANNYVLHYAHTLQYKDKRWAAGEKNYHVCETPNTYLFWDEVHPNTRAHHYMAFEACEAMKAHGYKAQCTQPELF